MTFSFVLTTVFEIMLFAAVIWGIFNEDKLVAFEKHILCLIKRKRLRVIKSGEITRQRSF